MCKMFSSTLRLTTRILSKEIILSNIRGKYTMLPSVTTINVRDIHITSKSTKEFRSGFSKVRAHPQGKDIVMDGEHGIDISNTADKFVQFPDATTSHKTFNGVPYDQLHVINIKSTSNNTIMSVTNCKGLGILTHSSGCEGFKHARKGTNIAAQQAAITIGNRAMEHGIKTVKLRVQGIGPGRMGAIKGLQLTGINVVSITDDTHVSWNPPRPKKQRRI